MNKKMIAAAAVAVCASGGLGAGVAAASASHPAAFPTQGVRAESNIADYCITYGTNQLTYDWNQAPCPSGTYPLSFVSAPRGTTDANSKLTLDITGTGPAPAGNGLAVGQHWTFGCALTTSVSAGVESDKYTCS